MFGGQKNDNLQPPEGQIIPKIEKKNSPRRGPETSEILRELQRSCDGLKFVSEIDSEVEPVAFPGMQAISKSELRRSLGLSRSAKMKTVDPVEFFENQAAERDWHDEEESRLAMRFAELYDLLKSELSEITVFRIGETRVEIYIIGKMRNGSAVGVCIAAVET